MDTTQTNKINYKMLELFILFPLVAGGISALLGGNMSDFNTINKPSFAPPPILFPIAWTVLYTLMGISSYLIYSSSTNSEFKPQASVIYLVQLLVNVLWTLFFFRFKWYLFSFIWLVLLIVLVISMIIKFNKVRPVAGYLQIPYLLWICFAAILNFSIYTLN